MFAGIEIYPYLQLVVNILLSNRWIGKLDPSAGWKYSRVFSERADLISQTARFEFARMDHGHNRNIQWSGRIQTFKHKQQADEAFASSTSTFKPSNRLPTWLT
jgi:hypothetical protein